MQQQKEEAFLLSTQSSTLKEKELGTSLLLGLSISPALYAFLTAFISSMYLWVSLVVVLPILLVPTIYQLLIKLGDTPRKIFLGIFATFFALLSAAAIFFHFGMFYDAGLKASFFHVLGTYGTFSMPFIAVGVAMIVSVVSVVLGLLYFKQLDSSGWEQIQDQDFNPKSSVPSVDRPIISALKPTMKDNNKDLKGGDSISEMRFKSGFEELRGVSVDSAYKGRPDHSYALGLVVRDFNALNEKAIGHTSDWNSPKIQFLKENMKQLYQQVGFGDVRLMLEKTGGVNQMYQKIGQSMYEKGWVNSSAGKEYVEGLNRNSLLDSPVTLMGAAPTSSSAQTKAVNTRVS